MKNAYEVLGLKEVKLSKVRTEVEASLELIVVGCVERRKNH
jgi:hypothetical protein